MNRNGENWGKSHNNERAGTLRFARNSWDLVLYIHKSHFKLNIKGVWVPTLWSWTINWETTGPCSIRKWTFQGINATKNITQCHIFLLPKTRPGLCNVQQRLYSYIVGQFFLSLLWKLKFKGCHGDNFLCSLRSISFVYMRFLSFFSFFSNKYNTHFFPVVYLVAHRYLYLFNY